MSAPKTIDELSSNATLDGTEEVPVWQAGTTKKSLLSAIATYVSQIAFSFLASGTGAISRTVQSKERDIISAFDFLSGSEIADVQARTLSLDVSSSYQKFLTALIATNGAEGFMPHGLYGIGSRLKLQNTYTSNTYVKLRGEGPGNPAVAATSTGGSILVGSTGGILLDMAGASNVTLEDLGMISGTSTPSTIGILGQRITANPYFQRINFTRVAIGMTPDATANGNLGTFAVVNKRGEHHHYKDCWFYADRPLLCDGSSVYATLISPDYAEATSASYTLSLNYFDNCGFIPATGDAAELRSTFDVEFRGGYMRLSDTYSGLLLGTYNANVSLLRINAELNTGTPKCLVRALNNADRINLSATTNISTLTAIRTVSAAVIQGADIELATGFTKVFDATTESGGALTGAIVKYNSNLGHTVPDPTSIYNSVLIDSYASSISLDVRPKNVPTTLDSGYMHPSSATVGTDATPVSTETYICEVYVPCTMTVGGASFLCGSVASGNAILALANASGSIVAQTVSFSIAGSAAAYDGRVFTSSYLAKGPGKYYVLLQIDNSTARYRAHSIGFFGASKKTGETFGTFTTITPPTTFTADLGPIAAIW